MVALGSSATGDEPAQRPQTRPLCPALASAAFGSLLLNYYFTPPLHQLTIAETENIVALVIFVTVAVSVASVVDLAARRTHQAARLRAESETLTLLAGSVLRGEDTLGALLERARETFGMESAEFLVAGHAGSTPRALARVASGGELSRIALAIAVTTAVSTTAKASAEASPGTLIFDEIDAGVGGAVAETVGRLMKRLGRERQVLAVTHLPQVAACADAHWLVSKAAQDGRTFSDVAAAA